MTKNKKLASVIAAAMLGLAVTAPALRAETLAGGTTVTVNATVGSINTLTTRTKLISDDSNSAVDGALTFTNIPRSPAAWSTLPNEAIQISVDDNSPSWRLRTYTNNTFNPPVPSTTVWGFAYGGMIGKIPGSKAAMAWLNNSTALTPSGPGTGDPSTGTVNGWTYFKDNHDVNDPGTATNESFAAADFDGYTNIAFGSLSETRIVRPQPFFGGSEKLAALATPWYMFVEADFSSARPDVYDTKLILELLNN